MSVVVTPYVLAGGGPLVTEAITDRRPDLEISYVEDEDALVERAADAEVILTHRLPEPILEAATGLQWVQALSAGTDEYDHDALAERDVALTTVSGVHGKPIGQHVLAALLHFERRFDRAVAQQQRSEWRRYTGGELGDRTVGIVGVGAIGSTVAEYCQPFDAQVVGLKRDPTDAPETLAEVYGPGDLEVLLAQSDYLVLACPLTEDTRGLIDADALAALPEDAVVVNVARGEVVDEAALIDALEADELGGAALDVFEEEPLPAESPLWDRDDVLLTPHIAGSTPHYWDRCAEVFLENWDRYQSGEPLRNRVV